MDDTKANAAQIEAALPEKASVDAHTPNPLHAYAEAEGYVLDADDGTTAGLRRASDGHTILIPQPSSDPHDPLNWSWAAKHTMLLIVSFSGLLADYGSAVGAITLIAQAEQWNMTEDEVNHSQAGNVFMLGVGGLFAVALASYFGRLPVVFWYLLVATGTAAWCAAATSFASFMTARILNGFFSTVTQAIGLYFVQDLFFFHERARKVNIWASFVIISPYMGPLLTAFQVTTQPWPVPFWVLTAMTGFAFVAATLFLRETYYDRRIAPADQPPRGRRVQRVLGIAQFRSRHLRNTPGQAAMRFVRVLCKPTVALTCLYYALTFAWVIGINTTLPMLLQAAYGFGVKQIGFFYFTPVVAVLLGELAGHALHDALARQYARAHGGRFEPEARLRAVAVSAPLMVVGLVLLGQALARPWHYMAAAVAWGLYVFGVMLTTVAVSSYTLDAYPEASGEVSALLSCVRCWAGFVIAYVQVAWATRQGAAASFGIQGGLVGGAVMLVLVLVRWGKAMRVWAGPLHFATA